MAMVILMLMAFAYQLTGNALHELVGGLMLLTLIAHNWLNRPWYKTLTQGKYPRLRLFNITINLLLGLDMLLLMVTGLLSSHILSNIMPKYNGLLVRQLHTLAAYWSLVLVGIHLGNHWNMISHKITTVLHFPPQYGYLLHIIALSIAAYGFWASRIMQMGAKLTLYYTFSYWDFQSSPVEFFLNYLAIIGLYTCITHYLLKLLTNKQIQNDQKKLE